MENKVITVVFAANEGYALFANVAITSLIAHAKDCYYDIYLLYESIDSSVLSLFDDFCSERGSVTCINIEDLIKEDREAFFSTAYFSEAMYYRLLIPELFPEREIVIYLDSDIVVLDSLEELIPKFEEHELLGAVRAPDCFESERLEKLQVEPEDYFNSGVLVFHIPACIQFELKRKCIELLKKQDLSILAFPDQDILNMVCKDRVHYIHPVWNYTWNMVCGEENYTERCREIVEEVGDKYKIIHYASWLKPWNNPEHFLSSFFWKYAAMSPAYLEILNMKYEEYIELEGVLEQERENRKKKDNSIPYHIIRIMRLTIKRLIKPFRERFDGARNDNHKKEYS